MLLRCNYEEVRALRLGADAVMEGEAPAPGARDAVVALRPRLEGDLSVDTLADQRAVALALDSIVGSLRDDMERAVVTTHPAHEDAVAAYFDFAHALGVQARLGELGREMEALIELVTGTHPTPEIATSFQFAD